MSRARRWAVLAPPYIVAVWAVILTFVVAHNYTTGNTISRARVEAVCVADNETRHFTAELLAVGATGSDPAAIRWQTLQRRLAGQLDPLDCTAISAVTSAATRRP